MAEPVCEICGAENPRWIRHIDSDIVDYAQRTMRGFPGRNSHPAHYCDTPECREALDERYGPPGNEAALARITAKMLYEAAQQEKADGPAVP